MKLSFLSFTALSLLLSVSALSIDSDAHRSTSLWARALAGETRPEERPNPGDKPPGDQTQPKAEPIPATGNKLSWKDIKASMSNLQKPKWVSRWQANQGARKAARLEMTDAARRKFGGRPGYRGPPSELMETDEKGIPTYRQVRFTSEDAAKLKDVRGTGGTVFSLNGRTVMVNDIDPITKKQTLAWPSYETIHVSPRDAIVHNIDDFLARQKAWVGQTGPANEKRTDVLAQISDGSGQPSDPQDSTAIFQTYFALLHSTQAATGDVIAPILNNLTSQSNSTLIHQMALSIYYDLTGSTTQLVGPFNNGMSYLGNSTNTTSEVVVGITQIYASMWTQAITAANSSGILDQQVFLTQSLYTNDTSVMPTGFQDTNNTSAQ